MGVEILLQHLLAKKKGLTGIIQDVKALQSAFCLAHMVSGNEGLYLMIEATK